MAQRTIHDPRHLHDPFRVSFDNLLLDSSRPLEEYANMLGKLPSHVFYKERVSQQVESVHDCSVGSILADTCHLTSICMVLQARARLTGIYGAAQCKICQRLLHVNTLSVTLYRGGNFPASDPLTATLLPSALSLRDDEAAGALWQLGRTLSPRRVAGVGDAPLLDKRCRHPRRLGQLFEQFGDDVASRFLPQVKMQRLDGLFRGLIRREARPLVPASSPRVLGLLEIPYRLP